MKFKPPPPETDQFCCLLSLTFSS